MVEQQEVHVDVAGRTLRLSNLDKVLYPSSGTTKGEVLDYYARIAPVLLPQLADRAVTRIRWPHGVHAMHFFEKNAPAGTPSWVRTVEVPTSGTRGTGRHQDTLRFPVVDDLATLMWLVNLAALELHTHQWRVDPDGTPRGADRLVIDLDPGEPAGLPECARVGLSAKEALAQRGLDAVPVLSGSKGLHLYAELSALLPPAETTEVAQEVAEELQQKHPKLVTATMTKARRRGKVFLDWSQNSGSKTTITPYSLRATDVPQVAAPLTWDEVEECAEDELGLAQFSPAQALDRVERYGDLLDQERKPT
jgi:bifunctional non-homologous end joining protein LigD